MKEFATQVVEEVQGVLKMGQQIYYQHKGADTAVCVDKQLLKNILLNLLSNASKYSGEYQEVHFTTKIREGQITIKVRGEGIGIPDADKAHLFTPFFRAHNVTNIQGTGLGLNIVKKYVDIMGGALCYASELDKGTTFTITLSQTTEP
ncbi:hypothetical protein GCM10027443_25580 [Pontibacter brevis]